VTAEANQGLTITLRAEFADAERAAAAEAALQFVLAQLEQYFQAAREGMLPLFDAQAKEYPQAPEAKPFMADALSAARDAVAKRDVTVKGRTTEAVIRIATDRPAVTAVMLLTLLPRAKKP
jgi:hypothetical protein